MLKKHEEKAKFSLILAAVGLLSALAGWALILLKVDTQPFLCTTFNKSGMFQPALGGALFVAMVASVPAFFLGYASAGQRRNSMKKQSWMGFFISSAAITLTLSAAIFFYLTRNGITPLQH